MQKIKREKALVLGIYHNKTSKHEALESFEEAKSLATTAGAELIDDAFIEIRRFNPGTFLGQGKVNELKDRISIIKPELIIVDFELSPVQNRNLENLWQTRVIDRTGLILDIFSQRARSKEGKLQVQLAQYEYLLPRLVGAWSHLKKSQGGIGFRGPGETQLEVDRRRVRERITFLKKSLVKVSRSREIHRAKRQAVPIPTISLIGYTNAGKSTLFNKLLNAQELAEDKLFATLDPKTKKLKLPSGQVVLISDTVGFIRNLPHQLVEAFRSTFEEVADSNLLIHMVDASHPDRTQQIATVEKLLEDLKLSHKPIIKALNKIDQMDNEAFTKNKTNKNRSVRISSLKGYGINEFLEMIENTLSQSYYKKVKLLIPHDKGKILNELFTHGGVIKTKNTAKGTMVQANLPPKWQQMYDKYRQ